MERTSSIILVTFMATCSIALAPLPAAGAQPGPNDNHIEIPSGYSFLCSVENRMGEAMDFERNTGRAWTIPFTVGPGQVSKKWYVKESGSLAELFEGRKYTGRVTSSWTYAGNTMTGVVLWDEKWPEAESCVPDPGPGCRLVFENKQLTLVSGTGGRRLLGDLAVKECSKNWNGFGGWLPWGIGCTYPKHDHPYVGTVVS
ncbi:uncharacterized protein [Lolium perenne]|uniref:uncharacterized protein n=1 Tax=Lolium perenne TaxID=4522 RepID=UPI0021F522BE|nr:uncharacterized protein LOC127298387 [Lolium perenne]